MLISFMLIFCAKSIAGERPKLIVGITVSQFYPEWINSYEYELGQGGFKRLLSDAKSLRADYGYAYSQTGTDHATIYTGTYPSEHGIVSHAWYDRMRKVRVPNIESDSTPVNMKVLGAAAYMKMVNDYSRVYSIAMRPEDALLSGGTFANNIFWFDTKTGKMTYSKFCNEKPTWLSALNNRLNIDSILTEGWMPLASERRNMNNVLGKLAARVKADFYYDLKQSKSSEQSYQMLHAVPYANDVVTETALELMKRERLGLDNETDLLMLSFSSLDYMNRDYAINSKEFKDLVLRLDRNIESLLTELDQRCGKGEYSVFVTFVEGREMLPVDLAQYRLSGNYFSIYRSVALLKSYLKLLYGQGEWILSYDSGQIYLNRELIQKSKLNLYDFQKNVADFLSDFEGISRVITASELNVLSADSGVAWLLINSFYPKRSGDVMFLLESSWIPVLQDREDVYCRYSKRRYVPLYFYGFGSDKIKENTCNMTDILPTICDMVGIAPPYNVSGSSLIE